MGDLDLGVEEESKQPHKEEPTTRRSSTTRDHPSSVAASRVVRRCGERKPDLKMLFWSLQWFRVSHIDDVEIEIPTDV